MKPQITWEDFEKLDIRCGTVISAEEFPEARNPSYKLHLDFGVLGRKKSSAQITELYQPADLIGKQVLAVVNFKAKQIANFISECLVLGVYGDDGAVVLCTPDRPCENGSSIG